jgi:hypothetical protein
VVFWIEAVGQRRRMAVGVFRVFSFRSGRAITVGALSQPTVVLCEYFRRPKFCFERSSFCNTIASRPSGEALGGNRSGCPTFS